MAACSPACAPLPPGPLHAPQGTEKAFLASLRARTVQVLVNCEGDNDGSGSGVILWSSDYKQIVATAGHVADMPECLYTVNGWAANILEVDEENDVALLETMGEDDIGPLALSHPYLGMEVIHVGYPVQYPGSKTGIQVSRGHLITHRRVSCSFWYGSSGGPVFDSWGRLVGLAVSFYTLPGTNFPIPDHYNISSAQNLRPLIGNVLP